MYNELDDRLNYLYATRAVLVRKISKRSLSLETRHQALALLQQHLSALEYSIRTIYSQGARLTEELEGLNAFSRSPDYKTYLEQINHHLDEARQIPKLVKQGKIN